MRFINAIGSRKGIAADGREAVHEKRRDAVPRALEGILHGRTEAEERSAEIFPRPVMHFIIILRKLLHFCC